MNKLKIGDAEFDVPDIAKGKVVPNIVYRLEREEELRKRAELGTLAGTILGWLLAKFF
mgnify:CR=1 FL=1